MACAGDVPTLETLAAVTLLRDYVPDIRVRVVNVVDLMTLQPASEHPHGLDDRAFEALFTHSQAGLPPTQPRQYACTREEEGTTTPFDMVVLNNLDRYQLALDAILQIPRLGGLAAGARARYDETLQRHKRYITEHGDDMPEVRGWRWSGWNAR